MSKRILSILVLGGLVLWALLTWFFGSFFYDIFWAFLKKRGVEQADVIAFTLEHLLPFLLAAIIIGVIYFSLRHEFAQKPPPFRQATTSDPAKIQLPTSPTPRIGIQIDEANRGVVTVQNLGVSPTKLVQFIVSPVTKVDLIGCEAWVTQIERITEPSAALIIDPVRCPWNQRTGEERYRVKISAGLTQRANLFSVSEERGLVPILEPQKSYIGF